MARVLIIDFEEDARATLCDALVARGHAVQLAATRAAGVVIWTRRIPDIVVVDVGTAENEGFEPWRALKTNKSTSASKLVVLTRKGRALVLDAIDAVFEKPFRVKDFCECVEALAHIRPVVNDESIECGILKFERRTGHAVIDGEEVDLTRLEHKLLVALYDRRPAPMSRASILHTVWNMNEDLHTRTIDTHVRRLRAKLGAAARCIVTVKGCGFAFDDGAATTPTANGARRMGGRLNDG
jgi:two-component system, OmpR family, phosphate regulon response regulator PhoB